MAADSLTLRAIQQFGRQVAGAVQSMGSRGDTLPATQIGGLFFLSSGSAAHGTAGQDSTATATGAQPAEGGGCEAPAADSHSPADRGRKASGDASNDGEAAA